MGKDFTSEGDLYYCEDFAVECVAILLEASPSTYHACKLVRYLADSKFGSMFNRQGMKCFFKTLKKKLLALNFVMYHFSWYISKF